MPVAAQKPAPAAKPEKDEENLNLFLKDDLPVHGWYRFVLSFPPHLVRKYIMALQIESHHTVLDPFCGTGTTLVECRKKSIASVGVEAHPVAVLASKVKTDWSLSTSQLKSCLRSIGATAARATAGANLESPSFVAEMFSEDSPPYTTLDGLQTKLIPEGFLSPKPMLRLLILRNAINLRTRDKMNGIEDFFRLAFCHVIVNGAGNFAFGPEIYRTKAKEDYDVLGHFLLQSTKMISELELLQKSSARFAPCTVLQGDARNLEGVDPESIDFLITSPPYPNEKDYTRITRVEAVLLGFISDKKQLRQIKSSLLRSNTRNVFVGDNDGDWVKNSPKITSICEAIEARREELGKTSGFERLYHRVVAHYFGGMAKHFAALHPKLKPKGKCAYVVGDQLSFLQVPIPTAAILGELAEQHGFRRVRCDLWRTRFGTKSGTRVREEILILEKR